MFRLMPADAGLRTAGFVVLATAMRFTIGFILLAVFAIGCLITVMKTKGRARPTLAMA